MFNLFDLVLNLLSIYANFSFQSECRLLSEIFARLYNRKVTRFQIEPVAIGQQLSAVNCSGQSK